MAEKYLTPANLGRFKEKLDDLYATSGQTTRFTAADVNLLSGNTKIDPNTLTPAGGEVGDLIIDGHHDAYLVTAIAEDGTLTVGDATGKTGAYAFADLADQPQIGGHALAAGDNTLDTLGIEAAGAAAAARTGAVDDVKKLGYQTADQVTKTVTDATAALQAKLGSVFNVKGSVAFADLPALDDAAKGDVYNVANQFTTTADFLEGAGGVYPAGTNVVVTEVTTGEGENATTTKKWDALSGVYDMSGYIAKTDLTPATDADIDALFA